MRAVAYARFSSDNQREESITAQLRAIREYADRQGATIVREYVDEARSATTDDRPGFLQMIADLRDGVKVDLVLVHKLDRFARNRYDAAVYRREIQRAGARLVAVAQPLDDSPESVILEAMLEAMAEYYSRNLGREVMKGMRETAYQGKHAGGRPPLGYDVDPVTRKYVINEEEAATVRLIFSMTLRGYGYGEIIAALNERGCKTKTGKPFGKNSIHDILRNEKYTGTYVFNRAARAQFGKRNNHASKPDDEIIRIPDTVPRIIDPGEWRQVQKTLDRRRQCSPRQRSEVSYILTGYVVCGECGAAMVGHSATGGRNRTRYHFYACNAKRRQKACKNMDIRKEVLEGFVLDRLEALFLPDQIEVLAERLEKRYLQQREEDHAREDQAARAIADITQRMDALFDALETGKVDPDVAGSRLNMLAKEKEALEQQLNETRRNNGPTRLNKEAIMAYLQAQRRAIGDRDDPGACRRLVEAYVERVVVHRRDVEVVLRFSTGSPNNGGGGGSRTRVRRGN